MSSWTLRTWLLRGLALTLVPLLILLIIELSLRLFSFGFNPAALKEISHKNEGFVVNNDPFTWRFFPPRISRDFDPFAFLENKAHNTFRIFVLGESAAQGVPDGAYSFSRQLEVMLRQTRPDLNFEVINTALTAVNSHVLLPLARGLSHRAADAVIIYMGNNEVVGPYGPGTVFKPFLPSLGLIRFNIALRATRLGQAMERLLAAFSGAYAAADAWQGMEMFLNKQLAPDDPRLETVYQHFRTNLRDMLQIFAHRKVPVLLCTVAVNLRDCPPFASLHRADLSRKTLEEWQICYKKGIILDESGEIASALTAYQNALELDDRHAELHYRIARCALHLQEFDLSARSYEMALELDALRFRTVSRLNRIIHETALEFSDQGVKLSDIEQRLRLAAPHGLPGRDLFVDHVHMSFSGNHLIARELFDSLTAWLPQAPKAQPLAPPSVEICVKELAYTTWNHFLETDEMLNAYYLHPPFSQQMGNWEEVARHEQKIIGLSEQIKAQGLNAAIAIYEEAIAKRPDDWRLRWKFAELLQLGLNDPGRALEQYEAMAGLVPHSYLPDSGIALMNLRLRNPDRAIEAGLRAVRIAPLKAEVFNTLALAHQMKGNLRQAEKHFSRAMDVQPRYEAAYSNLSRMQSDTGLVNEALETLRKGLLAIPGSSIMTAELADRLFSSGQGELAMQELRRALLRKPLDKTLNRKLSQLLWKQRM